MKFFTVTSFLSLVGLACATNYTVIVGGNNTLTYSPDSITGVNVGDTIAFQLYVFLHSSSTTKLINFLYLGKQRCEEPCESFLLISRLYNLKLPDRLSLNPHSPHRAPKTASTLVSFPFQLMRHRFPSGASLLIIPQLLCGSSADKLGKLLNEHSVEAYLLIVSIVTVRRAWSLQ